MSDKKVFLFILLFSIAYGCSRESIDQEPVLDELSEILIGEWEIVATVDPLIYNDTLWHELSFTSVKILFERDSTVTFNYTLEQVVGTYHTIDNDTISFMAPNPFKWFVLDFDEKILSVSLGVDLREGDTKKFRYAKIE